MLNSDTNLNTTDFESYGFKKNIKSIHTEYDIDIIRKNFEMMVW